jgi:hypothetical protein
MLEKSKSPLPSSTPNLFPMKSCKFYYSPSGISGISPNALGLSLGGYFRNCKMLVIELFY